LGHQPARHAAAPRLGIITRNAGCRHRYAAHSAANLIRADIKRGSDDVSPGCCPTDCAIAGEFTALNTACACSSGGRSAGD
jgi:hypothetical protein